MPTQIRRDIPRLLECPAGREYDEETFHYFLGVEQARAAHARRQVALLLAAFEPTPDRLAAFPDGPAVRGLFETLRAATRETDIVGWYRQRLVAGVVLDTSHDALAAAALQRRVESGLRRRLPRRLARRLHVQLVMRPQDVPNKWRSP